MLERSLHRLCALRDRRLITERLIERAHAVGVQVHVWTVNAAAQMERLAALGVDAIVTDDVEAYRSAIATPGADRWPFDVARVRLHFGRRLRMNGLGRAAREELYQALSTFTVLGADHWSARTADELRLLGESVTTFTPPRRSPQISATAHRIAEMAVSGMSNRAIAARMGIAPSTVGSHLSHVYRTVGVRSRTALRDCALFT